MSVAARSVTDLDLAGKQVFIRVDFNVPIKNGAITDDTRIRASLPTIQLRARAGRDGDPGVAPRAAEGQAEPGVLAAAGRRAAVASCSARPVQFAEDCVGEPAQAAIEKAGTGGVVLLENLRFHAEEEKNDPAFAKQLAALADVYVNDAFGSAHRAHASTEGIVHHVKEAAAGLLMAQGGRVSRPGARESRAAVRRRSSAAPRSRTSSR